MIQKHRISTNLGVDQKITVELKQDFDVLEILSLKFSQSDIYTSICSDYGVVCGRVTANNGFGLGNARVSIFIPLSTEDEDDPIISKLYPYKEVNDKDENGYRYNLLPKRQQHGGHAATGTFPDQIDVLTREEVLEVYEKYYKFTVKTNGSGDFMIWGVPVGNQTIHVDVDLSDIGCFSLRPNDFQRMGVGLDQFKNKYSFKSSEDLDSLPQIVTFDKIIEVYPFWGNEELCEIGISRTDFDLSERGINIQPKAYLIGGTFTDSGKNAINKNCTPRKKMGRKCDLVAKSAKIEAIRFSQDKDEFNRPYLQYLNFDEDVPDDGGFVIPIVMNMDYVITNEFGENEITNDPNKGIATSGCYRFRFNINDQGLERVRQNADYLIPNIREYGNFEDPSDQNSEWLIQDSSYYFGTDYSGYPQDALSLILNNEGGEFYPKDYFYRFNYNKVYTVSSFQGSTYAETGFLGFGNNRYLGLKDLVPGEEEDCTDNLTPPVNFGTKNYTFSILIADILLLLEYLFNFITLIFFNTGSRVIHTIAQFCLDFGSPLGGLGRRLKKLAYTFQDNGQKGLGLITYPECDECAGGDFGITSDQEEKKIKFCKVGEGRLQTLNSRGSLRATQIGYGPQYLKGKCLERYNSGHPEIIPLNDDAFNPFMTIQENYYISEGLIPITKPGTPNGSWFYEKTWVSWDIFGWEINFSEMRFEDGEGYWSGASGFFNYNIYYKFYDEDGNDWSSGAISTAITNVALESGCDIYDSPYNESLVNKYYTSETGDRSPVTPQMFNATTMNMVGANLTDDGLYKLIRHYDDKSYAPFTPSGQSEFKNGVFYVVPGSQTNSRLVGILKEHRIRKRVGKLFCGGIVSYGYIDNWLSGSLYFHQFKAKRVFKMIESAIRYCRQTVRFVTTNSVNRFYYRSTPILTGTTVGFVGKVENNGKVRRLGHPTTFVDLGPRDEFIKEICVDKSLDPNCSVSRNIGATSYKNFGELVGLAINYRLDTTNNAYNINSFFDNEGFKNMGFQEVFAGDILQLASINSEVGIEEFDLQSPKYLGYSYQYLDPELFPDVFKKTDVDGNKYWGPTPITFELDDSGERVRLCLNEPTHLNYTGGTVQGRLTESSQDIPFYLWDKKGYGFGGTTEKTSDDQSWDYTNIQLQPLQGMTFGYDYYGANDDDSDKYMLLPMTNNFSGLTLTNINVIGAGVEFDDIITGKTSLGNTLELGANPKIELYNGEYPGYTILLVDTGTIENPLTGRLYVRIGPAMGNSTHLGRTITDGFYKMNWDVNMDFSILPKKDYYSTKTKQILSTPFHFYFGLKAGKTGLDKFIDLFGPKDSFLLDECAENSAFNMITPTPTATLAPGPTPTPTPIPPTPTPTSTSTNVTYNYYLYDVTRSSIPNADGQYFTYIGANGTTQIILQNTYGYVGRYCMRENSYQNNGYNLYSISQQGICYPS